jgi:hypothetical protein
MLTPGEITVGMKITVVAWKPREVPDLNLFGDPTITSTVTVINDRSWCGNVLEVIAVDLPYIVIRKLDETMECLKAPSRLDTRECSLKELKPEYVKAILSS